MFRTAVTWNDVHTDEQAALFAAKAAEIYNKYPDFVVPEISTELQYSVVSPYLRTVYRTWPAEAAAQEWVDFLNSSNFVHLQNAVIDYT